MENEGPKYLVVEELEKIERPDPNVAVEVVRNQFKPILDEYCAYISDHVDHYWYRVKSETYEPDAYTFDEFTEDVRRHTQRYLYDLFSKKIRTALQKELLELTAEYMMKIRSVVPEITIHYSADVQESVLRVLNHESIMFHFEDVENEQFKKIPIYEWRKDRSIRNEYIKTLIRELKSNDRRLGLFDRQCIYEPTMGYYAQLERWADSLYNRIKTILINDLAKDADRWTTGGAPC